MNRFIAAAVFAAALIVPTAAFAQSGCPTIVQGAVLTAAQWNQCFQAKQNNLPFTPAPPGKSVVVSNGVLEATLPIRTTAGASKVFATADLQFETRRSNSGTAMTDTFPSSTALGMVNGARITLNNVDASANDTVTAGGGTTISGAATIVVPFGRSITFAYDVANTAWRPTFNTGTAVIGPASAVANDFAVFCDSTGKKACDSGVNVISITNGVANIATMQALGAASSGYPYLQVLGYNNIGDGGGGVFAWQSASTAASDHCVTFTATGVSTGRWVRLLNGVPLSVEDCGAYNNNTNGAATRQAVQYAVDYVATSSTPSATITMYGPSYLFDGTGIVKAQSFYCPNIVGGGRDDTVVSFSPGSEAAAFDFIGGSGATCKGGVRDLDVTGNANTIGCEFDGQDGAFCNIAISGTAKMAVLFCNCEGGAFTENSTASLYIPNMTGVGKVAEFRVNNSGDASFRGSGIGVGTLVSKSAPSATPMILIGSSAYVYNAQLNGVFTNSGGGTTNLIQNLSTNPVNFLVTSLDLETDNSNRFNLADPAHSVVYMSGPVASHGGSFGPGYGCNNVIFTPQYTTNATGITVIAHGSWQCGQVKNFTGNAGVILSPPILQANNTILQVQISGASNAYIYSGQVIFNGDLANTGSCTAVKFGNWLAEVDTNSWGDPVVTCSGGLITFSNAGWSATAFSVGWATWAL